MTSLSLRNETPGQAAVCTAPGCENPITLTATTGRRARYCSPACRARAHRARHTPTATIAEVTMGSATSRDRNPNNAWLVKLRRNNRQVIVAIGLKRAAADRLAQQINQLVDDPTI